MTIQRPLIVAIDGNNIIHRAHHALSRTGLSREDGQPVWALHGAANTIAKVLHTTRPQALVVTMDSPGGCPARRVLLPEYKGNRGAPAGELLPQLFEFPILLSAAGFSTAAYSGWEADDLMASIAAWSEANDWLCEIITSDRDAYQLLSDTVTVRKPDMEQVTVSDLHARYGVTPRQYLELAALRGEPGDNIGGVPGVGEKTAAKLIIGAGSIEALLSDPDRWRYLSPRGVEAVVGHREVVDRNLKVAALRRDLPVAAFVERGKLPISAVDAAQAFQRAGLRGAAQTLSDALLKLVR